VRRFWCCMRRSFLSCMIDVIWIRPQMNSAMQKLGSLMQERLFGRVA